MLMLLILYALILAEIAWDSFHELELNMSPNYEGSNLLRLIIGAFYWVVFPMVHIINVWAWLWIPVMVGTNFWFVFDTGLNLVRKSVGQDKELWYLGNGSKLDVWQKENGGAKRWWFIKALLAIISVVIFYLLNFI